MHKKKNKTISLQRLLVISITLLIVLSGLSIAGISYWGSRDMGYTMASQIMNDNSMGVLNKVIDYLSSASLVNANFAHLINSGAIDIDNPEQEQTVFAHYKHYLELYPEFAGIFFGDEKGRFLYGKRMPDKTISFRKVVQDAEGIHSKWIHENPNWYENKFANSEETLKEGYDPRKRPWYKNARSAGANIWSDVYIFASDKRPGITNAQPLFNENNYVRAVHGIDTGIIDISYFLNGLEISKQGKLLILNNQNKIIALSQSGEELEKNLKTLTGIEEFSDPVIRQSFIHYNKTKFDKTLSSFYVEKKGYVARYLSFPGTSTVDWQVGIILPEKLILGNVQATMQLIALAALIFIVLASLIGLRLARVIAKPLSLISGDMKRVRNFDLGGTYEIKTGLLELQEIDQSFMNMKNGVRSFSKYVPSKLVANLVTMGQEAVLGGERRNLTVFFSDINGFTKISEKMEPEQLVEELAGYLGSLNNIIQSNRGTVDKYIGDAIMAFWNAPEPVKNHAELACDAAIQIQRYLKKCKSKNPEKTCFPTRIGINTGAVLVGNIGSEERMNYTGMGDNINLGSRLENLNKYYGTSILISEETKKEAGNRFACRPIDKVTVKGKSSAIILYELVGYHKDLSKTQQKFLKSYESGLNLYLKTDWDRSIQYFEKCLNINEKDRPSQVILKRIEEFKKNPPPPNWDGVFVHPTK